MTYETWIEAYVARHNGAVLGRCKEAVAEMRLTFPELIEVRGHVEPGYGWGKRGHVWLEEPEDRRIIDPTASQFPEVDVALYIPWKPGDDVRVGKCMNCGAEIWKPVQTLDVAPPRASSCSEKCEAELMVDFGYEAV